MERKVVGILIAVALVAAGFYGGTVYEKESLSSQGLLRAAGSRQGGFAQMQGRSQNGTQQERSFGNRAGGQSGGFVAGDITAKDDTSITVKLRDGSTKVVYYSPSTEIGKSASGTAGDLSVGESIMVNGSADASGTVTAQSIQIRPATLQGGGGPNQG